MTAQPPQDSSAAARSTSGVPAAAGTEPAGGSVPAPAAADKETGFYYNLSTGQVEQGQQSAWTKRIGPYATREAAQKALETARARTEAWDEEDRRWREDDDA